MKTNYKRTLRGYSSNEVNEKITQLNIEFKEEFNKYSSELSISTENNKKLKQELEELKLKMKSYKESKEKLQEVLYGSFVQAFGKVYDSEKMLNEMIEYKTQILETQEKKDSEIKSSINKLLKEVDCIIEK
ncbi:hypothetical protein [Clostridium magnum]|uniref:Uncharacterized protein n=1 Tax=Clostridium magnum DSM 2767 TaxID=1121326 RepID=A0A162T239_9CLOT|nr:hypothetical protein [Clostridium magnum]KZL92153.1 hypothetical protein CLMAG_19620 [Clostridium magnum DSM 2767]SHH20178.1 hypothetical protein SAMN02745944_00265 [Clostridium magnum DSM 2767]